MHHSSNHSFAIVPGTRAAPWHAALGCAALLAGCGSDTPPLPVAPSLATVLAAPGTGAQGQVAFVSYRNANFDIYVADAATGRTRRLTRDKATDTDPAWSPDGQRIAFASWRDGNGEIYVMPATGGTPTRITIDNGRDARPAWSPDGTRLAITSHRFGSLADDIYVVNADGSGTATNVTSHAATDEEAAWSPDGSKLVFSSNRDNADYDLYVVNADGTGAVTRLTVGGGRWPAWSPDGTRLAFSAASGGSWGIYVTSADGTGLPIRLAAGTAPTWKPDGSRIAFGASGDIYAVNAADGTGITRLVRSAGNDQSPAWQP